MLRQEKSLRQTLEEYKASSCGGGCGGDGGRVVSRSFRYVKILGNTKYDKYTMASSTFRCQIIILFFQRISFSKIRILQK
jgi:hypothetical protein